MADLIRQTLSSNGNTVVIDWGGYNNTPGYYSARGTFGGGTTSVQVSFDGGLNYFSAGTDGNLTANGVIRFELPACKIRINLAGATTPSIDIVLSQAT